MGNINSFNSLNNIKTLNFEQMKNSIGNNIIINTLDDNNQDCLIITTVNYKEETSILNEYLNSNKSITIIIYGKNCNDRKVFTKYQQLYNLGFKNIFIYIGGLFEWLLLQEIYGEEYFSTTSKEIDILKFK